MKKQLIPDVLYEISEDGNLLDIEQGSIEPVCVQLHKIQIKHFAELMNVDVLDKGDQAKLTNFLEQINQRAEQLYHLISSIPCFPPRDEQTQEEMLAEELWKLTNTTLSLWGTGY
jgi:NADH:ubiquinone oxidoreductase subunit C